MRILVVGAGAIGGYFGGRMLQAGRDVAFLVRPKRAAELADAGLVIKSPNGDVTLKDPPALQADRLSEKFDVVLLSCKAFDLDDAIKSFAPAVGPQTSIIPLLNGMLHLDVLDGKFGPERVLGGLCAAQSIAIAQFRRTRRQTVGPGPRHCRSHGERQFRLGGQRKYRAGDVGEMGFSRHARGLHLPDAGFGRQYPGVTGRQGFYPRHAR
jgi:2-dehydropantoate 2-reductase